MADGQGIAHPRRMGLAAHLGLLLDVPSFGCAKSRLFGEGRAPNAARGSFEYLTAPNTREVVGTYVRTKDRVAPVIVSAGHRITLEEAVALTLDCACGYRIPEPTRLAHHIVNRFRRGEIQAY